ncbi:MAG: tRNA pseudouridine(55) synthase TruB [Pseudomonadales bacterium]
MPQKRLTRHAISGVLILNKPLGLSSNGALQRVKYLLRAKKAGHTGALDPLATGVLPLCFGEATKFSNYLLDADKTYQSEFTFGVATDSGDSDGEILREADASEVRHADLLKAIEQFSGDIEQVPPMYSALKHQGQPLYKLARQGVEITRRPRPVTIKRFELLDFQAGKVAKARVEVECSKGTYIRSLAMDIGELLGVGGHVSALHRIQAGPFRAEDMLNIDDIALKLPENESYSVDNAQKILKPVDAGIEYIPALEISAEQAADLRLGRKITVAGNVSNGLVRVMLRAAFIGLADANGQTLQPKRLVVENT